MNDDPKMMRISYEPGESGWAEDLGSGRARIANIPLSDLLNLDDEVSLELKPNGMLQVDRVLVRKYAKKTALSYGEPYQETYDRLREALTAAGIGTLEGWSEGILLVAHTPEQDPLAICEKAGLKAWIEQPQPNLEAKVV